MRRKVPEEIKKEIENLFEKAEEISLTNEEKAKKIVKKARQIAKHHNYRIPERWRDKFCHKCNAWFTGKNIKVRISKGKISTECLSCGNVTRKKFKTS